MPTTSNFGWTTPADTDLVKDGAAAIRTLGNGIDTSFLDLKGGTTDQVLAKNSNTDLDFKWVAQDDSNAIQNAIVDAKGDLISATAADTPARLAVGTNGHILTADSSTATGLKWAAPAGSGTSWTEIGSVSPTGTTTASFTSLSGYNKYFIQFESLSPVSTSGSRYEITLNSDASNYYNFNPLLNNASSTLSSSANNNASGFFNLGTVGDAASATMRGFMQIDGANTTGVKTVTWTTVGSGTGSQLFFGGGRYAGTSTISTITLTSNADNFDAGTIRLFGSVN